MLAACRTERFAQDFGFPRCKFSIPGVRECAYTHLHIVSQIVSLVSSTPLVVWPWRTDETKMCRDLEPHSSCVHCRRRRYLWHDGGYCLLFVNDQLPHALDMCTVDRAKESACPSSMPPRPWLTGGPGHVFKLEGKRRIYRPQLATVLTFVAIQFFGSANDRGFGM